MYHSNKRLLRLFLTTVCMLLFISTASASEISIMSDTQFCFSSEDFAVQNSDDGIFLTSVPQRSVAEIYYGNRLLKAGDAIPNDALGKLTMTSTCKDQRSSIIEYCIVSNGAVVEKKELAFSLLPKKNSPPTAEDSDFETYRNIANSGKLSATDPDGDSVTYEIVMKPKRGTVEIHEDGTFLYTPDENKVGKDSFTFTVTDEAGQVSSPAKVSIEIKKPSDRPVYADMMDDKDQFYAVWMKEEGLFKGTSISGHLCFSPDEPVSRGEFLVMTMKLVGADADQAKLSSGFADEAVTPLWMRPYIVSALSNGMITGTQSDGHMVFRPNETLTQAEAAVMLQNILQLPTNSVQAVSSMEGSTIPVWALQAASALSYAGIELEPLSDTAIMTRRDTANVLYQVNQLLKQDAHPTFYWIQ